MTSKPTPKAPKPKATKGPRRKPKATKGPAQPPKEPTPTPPLPVLNLHAAAIDVHSDNHVVCVGPGQVETFGAYTVDLEAIADHLFLHGVTTVVLESTGVYWIPLFEVLEGRGFEVFLIEPSQASHCGARPKSDPHDCQWLQRLHGYGLLRASFRPPASVLALRGYWRQRQNLVRYAAGHVQHVQKALEQMNVKLTEVAGDLMGVTGTRIIEAIVAGERDPQKLAGLRDGRCRRTEEEYVKALEGHWRQEHLFELKQVYELYRFYHQKITECDEQIQAELTRLPDRAGGKAFQAHKRTGCKSNDLRFDASPVLFKALGVDLTLIEGIDVRTALVILAEIGVDVSRFPTEKHFVSWLRLCPQFGKSNNSRLKPKKRKATNRISQALRMAAQALGKMKTPLAAFYHRMKSRLGGRGAITATAHKLAVLVYRLLKYGTEYVRQSMEEYTEKLKTQLERRLHRQAAELGYELVAKPKTAAAAT
jgi:transposase